MKGKGFLLLGFMLGAPTISLAFNQSSLFFLTLGIDIGIIGTFAYLVHLEAKDKLS